MSSKPYEETLEGLEATLVERYMQRNGWEFPSGNMGCEDYDAAVEDVKWFLSNLEELGYRKPPDRPELENEITNTLKRVYIRANGSLPNATQMQLIWNDVDYILALIPDRLPKDKPLLLSDDEINKAFDEAFDKPISFDHKPTPEEIITIRLRAVAQAQWNICVYHSEGGNRA